MADHAICQSASITLKINELDRVVVFAAGGDGVRAIVASLTTHPTVAGGEAIQGLVLVELLCGCGRVAGVTTRFIQPGVGVLSYLTHCAVTINTVHLAGRVKRRLYVQ